MKPGKMLCSDVSHAGYTLFISCVNLASSRMSKLESLIREEFFIFFHVDCYAYINYIILFTSMTYLRPKQNVNYQFT